jgi:hypothetical protein
MECKAYNGLVADSLKVPKEQFEAAIRALLNARPIPMAEIPKKAKAKQKKRG